MALIFASLEVESEYFPMGFLFYSWDDFHEATFNPTVNVRSVVDLSRVRGKTYSEKQGNLRDMAIEFQHADEGGLSMNEWAIIGDFFERYGKRYGLLREFRENAII